jgi:hypothetical protein
MKPKKLSRSTNASTPVEAAAAQPQPTREQIQALAHAIWKDRGCPQDCDMEIWLEAERQLCVTRSVAPREPLGTVDESVDPDRSDAARIDRELDRIVSPPEQRSPTSL